MGGWIDASADVDLRVGGRYHLSIRDALHGVGVNTEIVALLTSLFGSLS